MWKYLRQRFNIRTTVYTTTHILVATVCLRSFQVVYVEPGATMCEESTSTRNRITPGFWRSIELYLYAMFTEGSSHAARLSLNSGRGLDKNSVYTHDRIVISVRQNVGSNPTVTDLSPLNTFLGEIVEQAVAIVLTFVFKFCMFGTSACYGWEYSCFETCLSLPVSYLSFFFQVVLLIFSNFSLSVRYYQVCG